jgi:hypothetical protein
VPIVAERVLEARLSAFVTDIVEVKVILPYMFDNINTVPCMSWLMRGTLVTVWTLLRAATACTETLYRDSVLWVSMYHAKVPLQIPTKEGVADIEHRIASRHWAVPLRGGHFANAILLVIQTTSAESRIKRVWLRTANFRHS